jgi:hypothetical protein
VVKAETIDPRDVPCDPAQGTSRILLAVLMPADDAELLSDIRYIDEHGPTNRDLACARQNNFIRAGINGERRRSDW